MNALLRGFKITVCAYLLNVCRKTYGLIWRVREKLDIKSDIKGRRYSLFY